MNLRSTTRDQASVLIVDDSAFMRTALTRMIAAEPDIAVVGTAWSGEDALAKIASLNPDVVTLDVEMPGMGGLEALRAIMATCPRPVIMVSSVTLKEAHVTFDCLSAGAFDYVPKQMSSASLEISHIRTDLLAKIRGAVHSRRSIPSPASRKPPRPASSGDEEDFSISPAIVAIGTSTGGPKALQEILPLLPKDFPVPIVIVQHTPPGFTQPFAQRLDSLCSVSVREAVHHDSLQPGVVYIAPAGRAITIERPTQMRALISLDAAPGQHLHTPSADILMKSVATNYGSFSMGIILTGMGSDGAQGMKAIYDVGGFTIGQDEDSCAVYSMPRACAELGILKRVLPLSQIPKRILQATRYRQRA
jgi:two-component system chemotaxis response regulator CheB